MLNDPPSYLLFCMGVIGLIYCYHKWRELDRKCAEDRRQWVRDVNKLAERYGHPELAGRPDNPHADFVKRFEADETPAQVIAAYFSAQQPTS